jgi:hypothetical protein
LQGSDFVHQIEAGWPSLGRSYEGTMQLDEHERASTERWKGKPALQADTDQVPETWDRRLKGNGQVTHILQAAHVAAYLFDPAHDTVDKDCVSFPEYQQNTSRCRATLSSVLAELLKPGSLISCCSEATQMS